MRPQSYCQLSDDARNICLTLYGTCHGIRHRFEFSRATNMRLVGGSTEAGKSFEKKREESECWDVMERALSFTSQRSHEVHENSKMNFAKESFPVMEGRSSVR